MCMRSLQETGIQDGNSRGFVQDGVTTAQHPRLEDPTPLRPPYKAPVLSHAQHLKNPECRKLKKHISLIVIAMPVIVMMILTLTVTFLHLSSFNYFDYHDDPRPRPAFTATSRPPRSVARCTCAMEALPRGRSSKVSKTCEAQGPKGSRNWQGKVRHNENCQNYDEIFASCMT